MCESFNSCLNWITLSCIVVTYRDSQCGRHALPTSLVPSSGEALASGNEVEYGGGVFLCFKPSSLGWLIAKRSRVYIMLRVCQAPNINHLILISTTHLIYEETKGISVTDLNFQRELMLNQGWKSQCLCLELCSLPVSTILPPSSFKGIRVGYCLWAILPECLLHLYYHQEDW